MSALPPPPTANTTTARPDHANDSASAQASGKPTSNADPSAAASATADLFAYRRGNGKIAKLPKQLRDEINESLASGCPYRFIIEVLRQYGHYLTPNNLSQWKKHGYQHWLLEQRWLAQIRLREDTAADLSGDFNAHDLSHATLQLALLQMFEAMRALSEPDMPQATPDQAPATAGQTPNPAQRSGPQSKLNASLGGDARMFFSFVQTLARASKELTNVQQCRNVSTPDPLKPFPPLDVDFTTRKPARKIAPGHAVPAPTAVPQPLAKPAPKPVPASPTNSQPPAKPQANGRPQISAPATSPTSSNPAPAPISTPPAPPTSSVPSTSLPREQPTSPPQKNGESSSVGAAQPQAEASQPEPSNPGNSAPSVPLPQSGSDPHKPAAANTEEPNPTGYPPEFCLRCGARLPNRLANRFRPFPNCKSCGRVLPSVLCNLSSLEKCPGCMTPLPRPNPSGRRLEPGCYSCGLTLGDPPEHVMVTVREYWRQWEADLAKARQTASLAPP